MAPLYRQDTEQREGVSGQFKGTQRSRRNSAWLQAAAGPVRWSAQPRGPQAVADPLAAPAALPGTSLVSRHPVCPPSSVRTRFLPSTGAGESCRWGHMAPAPLLLDLSTTPAGAP